MQATQVSKVVRDEDDGTGVGGPLSPTAAELAHATGFHGFDLAAYRQVQERLVRTVGAAPHRRVLEEVLVAQVHAFAFDPGAVHRLQEALGDGGAEVARAAAGLRAFAAHFGLDLDEAVQVARVR